MKLQPTEKCFFGQIETNELPAGWSRTSAIAEGIASLAVFTPSDEPNVQLAFYYRGMPISQQFGEAFKNVLEKNQGVLLPRDLESISYILNDRKNSDKYQMTSAETVNLNGRIVLLVQGSWLGTNAASYEVFINAGRSGCLVQQIAFVAPKESFHRHVQKVKYSLKTIQWLENRS